MLADLAFLSFLFCCTYFWLTELLYWWLVRVTLVVDWLFLPQNFGPVSHSLSRSPSRDRGQDREWDRGETGQNREQDRRRGRERDEPPGETFTTWYLMELGLLCEFLGEFFHAMWKILLSCGRKHVNMYVRCPCEVRMSIWGENAHTMWECPHKVTFKMVEGTSHYTFESDLVCMWDKNAHLSWECPYEVRMPTQGNFSDIVRATQWNSLLLDILNMLVLLIDCQKNKNLKVKCPFNLLTISFSLIFYFLLQIVCFVQSSWVGTSRIYRI